MAQLVVAVRKHCRRVEHHDGAQIRQLIGNRQNPIDIFLVFGDEHERALPSRIW